MKKFTLSALVLASALASCGVGGSTPNSPSAPSVPVGTVAPEISGFRLSGSERSLTVGLNVEAACVFKSNAGTMNMAAATLEGSPFAYKVSLAGEYTNATVVCTNSVGSDTMQLGTLRVG